MLLKFECLLKAEYKNLCSDSSPYKVNVTQGTDSYTYFLNVCGQLGIPCGKEHENHEAVCQVNNKDDHSRGKSLGDAYHKTLKYAKLRLSDQIIVVVKV